MIRLATVSLLAALLALPVLAETSTRISAKKPILNFSLPTFTNPGGHRDWLIRGSQAWMTDTDSIDIKELNATIFSGDASNRIDTIMVSSAAQVRPKEKIITSDSPLRIINVDDGFEATSEGWMYTHQNKTVTLRKKVRVTLRAEIKNLLQ
jgi:Lipopolysaccharide-assembly, LptC-related